MGLSRTQNIKSLRQAPNQ